MSEVRLEVTRVRSLLWDALRPEQRQAVRDFDAIADEVIVDDALGSGYPATLRTVMTLELDQLLFGDCFAKLGDEGLLERMSPLDVQFPSDDEPDFRWRR